MNEINEDKKFLVIYGCGGHARSVADVALFNGTKKIIFLDKNAKKNEKLLGHDVLLPEPTLIGADYIVAVGDNEQRKKIFTELKDYSRAPITLIAKDAYISEFAQAKLGTFIGHSAYVGPNAQIGENTIINTHAVIEHDCIIGSHSHVAVNATIAGKSRIGNNVMIGAGATVIDNVYINSNIIVGAGAVVASSLEIPGVYVGVPARRIK